MQTQLNTLIDGVIAALGALRADINIYFATQEQRKEQLAQDNSALAAKVKDIEARENAVKEIEDIVVAKVEAEKLSNEARELMGKTRDAETNFNNWARSERDTIAKAAAANVARTNELNSEFAELNKQKATFATEKEDWELKAAQGIVKLAAKK